MEYNAKLRLFICVILSLFMAGSGFSEERIHVIRQGETIYSIARSYGVNFQEILTLNKITDARTVQAGAKIRIPGAAGSSSAVSPPAPQSYGEYRVEKNDTLYSLARRYSISVAELLDMNGFAPNYVIKAGEKIRIPAQGIASSGQSGTQNVSGQTGGSGAPALTGSTTRLDPSIKWPVKAKEISFITGNLHGVQVTGELREGVKSLTGGTVVSAGPYRGFGRVAIIQATGGYLYVYGGCETLSVKEGDKVIPGTELGKLGIDTKTAKSQLFFFVYRGNTPVDPAKAPRA